MTEEPRVLVVAGSLLARSGLAALLGNDTHVIGQVSGGKTLSRDLDVYRPDLVVIDLDRDRMPDLTPLADMPLVVLVPDRDSAADALIALNGSAYGVLLPDAAPSQLVTAIHAVLDGLVVLDPALAVDLLPQPAETALLLDELTPREHEVLQLLAQGLPNKTIAQKLDISPNTVKFHINGIFSKLGAQSRTEAVVRGTQLGLILL